MPPKPKAEDAASGSRRPFRSRANPFDHVFGEAQFAVPMLVPQTGHAFRRAAGTARPFRIDTVHNNRQHGHPEGGCLTHAASVDMWATDGELIPIEVFAGPNSYAAILAPRFRSIGENPLVWRVLGAADKDAQRRACPAKRLGGGRSQRRSGPSETAKLLLGRPLRKATMGAQLPGQLCHSTHNVSGSAITKVRHHIFFHFCLSGGVSVIPPFVK